MTSMYSIAVIDDHASVRNSIALALKMNGYAITTFENPIQFLSAKPATKFDLLLVDIDMPLMTGLELHKHLSQNLNSIPAFILMSGRVTETDSVIPPGVKFLEKPFSLNRLLTSVIDALRTENS